MMSIRIRDYYLLSPTVGILEALEIIGLKPGGSGNDSSPGKKEKGHQVRGKKNTYGNLCLWWRFWLFLPLAVYFISETFLYIFYLFFPDAFWGYSLTDTNSLIHSSIWIITLLNQCVEFIISTIIFCAFTISSCIHVISFYACINIKLLIYLMIFNILLQNICPSGSLILILRSRWFCLLSSFCTDCVIGGWNLQRSLANGTSDSVYVPSLWNCVCAGHLADSVPAHYSVLILLVWVYGHTALNVLALV